MHYYQFNIADYRKDTAHLSLVEHGVYRQLLDWYYLDETPIPKETQVVYRRLSARTEEERNAVDSVLNDFFFLTEAYHHQRCDDEIRHYQYKAEINKRNGKLGGRPAKTQSVKSANRTDSENNPNQQPITNNQQPIKTNDFFLPAEVSESVWADFVQHRKEIRKPLKPLSKVKSANILKALSHEQQRICVDKSIASGWAGLFPDKQQEQNNGTYQQDNSAVARVRRANGITDEPSLKDIN